MYIVNKCLQLDEFERYVEAYEFTKPVMNKLVVHHTYIPTKVQWNGQHSINGLRSYYERKGWRAGPHLFVAEDGIWLFSPMNKMGIHAGAGNWRSIGIEVVGNYDTKKWSGKTKENALGVIRILMKKLGLKDEQIRFHREFSHKSCPGWAITKEWLFQELNEETLPDWGVVAHNKTVKEIWEASKKKKYLSDKSKFNQPVTKGELMIILARIFKSKF